jgi:hypothetical protein
MVRTWREVFLMKWQRKFKLDCVNEAGENYIVRRFVICSVHKYVRC